METISAIVITRNEEAQIGRCLESVRWVDEIVIVDSHSSDRTREIARTYTPHVYEEDWKGYGLQKASALAKATGDWVLSVDADEEVTPALREEILRAVRNGQSRYGGYLIPRRFYFLGQPLVHGGLYPKYYLRFFRRDRGTFEDRLLHEGVRVTGSVGRLRGDVLHYSYRDLQQYWEKAGRYAMLYVEMRRNNPISLWRFFGIPLKFVYRYVFRLGFLDGRYGLYWHGLEALQTFFRYAALYEAQRSNRGVR
jgi:glycosyltransferase involved in cell wall biosynthesis